MRPFNQRKNEWQLMPDGLLTDCSSLDEEFIVLCVGAGILAGKVGMFPTYESQFSIDIKDFERVVSDFGELSLYRNAQDLLHSVQRSPATSIKFHQQKRRFRNEKNNDRVVIESFLRALAVQGSGFFPRDQSGVPRYHPNKPIIAGLPGYPLAINSKYVLKAAMTCLLDIALETRAIASSPSSSANSSPVQKGSKTAVTSPIKPQDTEKNTDANTSAAVRTKTVICVPSALSCRGRSDLLDSYSGCGGQVRCLIR
jgi:hypothetical protein